MLHRATPAYEKLMKQMIDDKWATKVDACCPRCGHDTLLMPGSEAHLHNVNPSRAVPMACIYPNCGYKNADERVTPETLHAQQVNQMKVSQTINYFDNFSVVANDDDFKKSFDNFHAPTPELQEAKSTAERTAEAIANGKVVHSFILGDTGVGKTHLAYAMMSDIWNLTKYRKKIIFLNMLKLAVLHNKAIHDDQTRRWFDKLLYQIKGADLIVLDDLGREQNNNWNKLIVDITASDRENQSIIITSNVSACKRYSSQTLDRLKEHSKGYAVMLYDVKSYRTTPLNDPQYN